MAQIAAVAEYPSAVVASVLEQVHSIAEKLFEGDSLLRLLLDVFLGDWFFGDYPHDAAALRVLLEGDVGRKG